MSKLVSICMATYNGEKYIKEQLDSLIEQKYKNYEIIIQDDCSSDNTFDILKSYEDRYDFIKVYKNEKNLGYIKNFETLIKRANGNFIALCDQDDVWLKDKLSILIEAIGENSLVYANSALVDDKLKSLNKSLSQKLNNNFISSNEPLNFLFDNCVSAHAMLFKKELLDNLEKFPKSIYFDQYIAMVAASKDGVKYIDKELVLYRQHSSNTLKKEKKAKPSFIQKIKNKLSKKLDENNTNLEKIREIKQFEIYSKGKDMEILNQLENIYKEFKNIFINPKAFIFFISNRDKLLKITRKNVIIYSIKASFGYRLYKVLPIL